MDPIKEIEEINKQMFQSDYFCPICENMVTGTDETSAYDEFLDHVFNPEKCPKRAENMGQ